MDPSITSDLEAPKDPGALRGHADVTDNEILGKIWIQRVETVNRVIGQAKCLILLSMTK